jgi:hypothetical protein
MMTKPAIQWLLLHAHGTVTHVAGFIRTSKGGALVIGGETGTHFTGHGERWDKKWQQLVSRGFITLEDGVRQGVVDQKWAPPELTPSERDFVDQIGNNQI